MSLFDETQTYEPMDKYAAHTAVSGDSLSLPETIIGGAVATLTDIGTTYWNSLTPERFNASTSDLLSRIDDDALQVYNENPETIKALSFIGGMVAPIGLSVKGMNALRSGTKGFSWFSEAGQKANMMKVEEAFKNSRGAIDESFIKAKWDVYRGVALNAVADNVAAEIAILGTLSAHPYMEDYFKDFGSNFVKSVAFGSGIQTGIGSIISKFEISKLTGAVEKQVIGKIKTGLIEPLEEAGITERSHLGELAAVQFQSLENMKAQLTLADKGEIEMVPFVRAHLGDQIQRAEAELVVKMKGATSGELSKFMEVADQEKIEHFLKFIGQDNIAGLDKIAFAEVKGLTIKGEKAGILQDAAKLFKDTVKKLKSGDEIPVTMRDDALWTPLGGGRFIAPADAPYYLQAADLGKSVDELDKVGLPFKGKAIYKDWGMEVIKKHSAEADADFMTALLASEKLSAKELSAIPVSIDNLPMIKAFYSRAGQILGESPAESLSFRLIGESGAETKISSIEDLGEVMRLSQAKIVEELKASGYGIETISLKTGTPIETVEAIIQNGRVEGAGLLKYSSRQDVEVALDYKNRSLALSTDMNKVPQPEMLAALNARNLEASSQGILEQVLLSSRSETVQGFATTVLSPAMKDLSRWIYKEAENIAPSLLKSSMFASTNQVLEALGPLGTYINAFGKEVIAAKNTLTETFEKPLANLMGAVIKNGEAALIEGNTAIAVQASIKGRKLYKDGAFWVISDGTSNSTMRQLIAASDDEFRLLIQAAEEAENPLVTKASYNGNSYDIATQEVRSLMESLQKYGREMYEIKNARNIALGRGELQDIGFWAPSFNPRDKSVAYVFDKINKKTSMLFAKTDEALAEGIKNYEDMLFKKHGGQWRGQFDLVTKDNQEYYNQLAGRHDPLYMDAADLSKQHGGASTPAVVSTDTSVFQELLGGYQTHSQRAIEDVAEIHLDKVMALLKDISDVSQGIYAKETKGVLSKLGSKPVDAGQTVRNILLGRPLISEHKAWQEFQQRGQVWTDQAFKTIATAFEPLVGKSVTRSADEWNKVVADMEAKGIVNPFDGLDKEFGLGRYMTEGKGTKEGLTPRAVALGNAAAATIMLRFADLAQPLINAISLPILTAGAINRRMAASFAGEALDPNAKFTVASAMMDGIRFMNHQASDTLWKEAGRTGMLSMELRNVSEMLEHQRSLDPGLMTKAEAFLEKFSQSKDNTSALRFFTKAADKSEEMVRAVAFFTAANIAKKAYPGIGTSGIMAYARNFMDETIGNYTAAQRPALFQGTFGVAMGLFQTYMLTMAQSMYRNVQYRDWATLGKMLLTQSSIFGAGSLPGFQVVSEQIAKSFSDQNIDLETGTIRAVGDPLANIILYGMPSSFGPGISTRGDLQPRIPNPFQVDSIAAVNMTVQSYQALERVVSAAMTADANTGKAMLEALSLQSISRPVARISELFSGQSITSRGDVVDSDVGLGNVDNILSLSTLSRVMATRPLEEIKARQALHHNSLYQSFDAEKRRGVTNQLKSYIRNGNLDSEKLEQLAEQYLRTGSSGGWRMAVQDAIRQAGAGGDATTLAKLKKNSPLQMMIEDLD